MSNFRDDILAAADGEPIEAITLLDSGYPRNRWWKELPFKTVLSWNEVAPLLDHTYDTGYGGQDCPDIFAWTARRVLCVHEYDGATNIRPVPRHPQVFEDDKEWF